jgi:hypothetical protein
MHLVFLSSLAIEGRSIWTLPERDKNTHFQALLEHRREPPKEKKKRGRLERSCNRLRRVCSQDYEVTDPHPWYL